jgi:hypothetical protein
MGGLDRAAFVSLATRGGAMVALGAAGAGLLATSATAATAASGPLADQDLALARLTVGAELLAADFYGKAIDSGLFEGDELKALKRVLFNEQEHLAAVSGILTGAGQAPSTADDFSFAYPDGAFGSRASIARLGVTLETAFVGAYVGAAASFVPVDLRSAAASIAASEAEHLGLLSGIAYGRPVGISFPPAFDLAAASDALAPFLS